MDHFDIIKNVRSAKPNPSTGQFLPFFGVSLGNEESSSGLMNIDGKTFLRTVGQELLGANYEVKGYAGQKRSTSKTAQTTKSASAATKKSAGTKMASKKTSKPRKSSAKKPSKPKKKSAGTKKTSTSKARKNSAGKKKPKPKNPSKGKAGTDPQQQSSRNVLSD